MNEKMNEKMINDIKKFMKRVNEKFKNVKFRCEYEEICCPTYIVEVKPVDIFENNKEYGEMEYDFTREFQKKFAGCMIMFVSDNSLVQIENSILEVGYNVSKSKQIPDTTYGSNCYV